MISLIIGMISGAIGCLLAGNEHERSEIERFLDAMLGAVVGGSLVLLLPFWFRLDTATLSMYEIISCILICGIAGSIGYALFIYLPGMANRNRNQ